MDNLLKSLQSFAGRWGKLSLNQRLVVGTLILGLILSTFFLFNQAQDDYEILYSNMSLPDAAAAAAKLKEMKAPFKLADGGTTIMVPRNRRNELVLDTANELTSDQTVNLASIPPVLQGDVQKEWIKKINTDNISGTLRSIRGIKNAKVMVSQPEHSVFVDDQEATTASVMLMVEPGFRLSDGQVKTIKNLVSHAVPGLKPENVAIADNSGNALEGPAGAGGGYSDADQRRKKFEEETAKKVLSILTPVVGKDNAVVSVSAAMNFDHEEAKIHRVIPTGGTPEDPSGMAVSTQEQTEEYAGGDKGSGAPAAGVDANTQTFQGAPAGGDDKDKNNYKLSKKTTNYVNSEEERSVIYAGGNLERMTVAVVLNKVLTAKETEEIRQLVENASGVDNSRGDSVDIKGFQFTDSPGEKEKALVEATKTAQEQSFILQLATVGGVVMLGLAALFIFHSFLKGPVDGEVVEEDAYDPYEYEEPEAIAAPEIPVIETGPDPEIEMKRASLNQLIEKDASEAARVLISYIKGS
jgi:flagellar M-ring protein FliF